MVRSFNLYKVGKLCKSLFSKYFLSDSLTTDMTARGVGSIALEETMYLFHTSTFVCFFYYSSNAMRVDYVKLSLRKEEVFLAGNRKPVD
jgi:hypothetical protein